MPNPKLIFATDLHGNIKGFRSVLCHAASHGISTVVFGGDINPKKHFLRFKDGTILPDRFFPDLGFNPDVFNAWLGDVAEKNRLAQESRDPPKFLAVDDSHYGVTVRLDFNMFSARFRLLYERLWVHTRGERVYIGRADLPSAESGTPESARKFFAYPKEAERELILTKILPLIKRKIPSWIVKSVSEEDILEAYLSAAGDTFHDSSERSTPKKLLYSLMRDAITKSFADESGKLLKVLKEWEVRGTHYATIEKGQLNWLKTVLFPELAEFMHSDSSRQVFIMPGNDDVTGTLSTLDSAERKGILTQVHGKVVPLNSHFFIGGYSFVSDLPPNVLGDWLKDELAIASDLRDNFGSCVQERTVLSIHVPPRDGLLDITSSGKHIGSSAVREYLANSSHPLVLTGHVHEAPTVSGSWSEIIGNTMVINPGASHDTGVDAVVLDLGDIKNTKRLKLD